MKEKKPKDVQEWGKTFVTRRMVLENLELFDSLQNVMGEEALIDWILKEGKWAEKKDN
jgi:hypothetical protein